MLKALAKVLVNKNILVPDMEVDAEFYGVDLSGNKTIKTSDVFFIHKIVEKDDDIVFILRATKDGSVRNVLSEDILKIEGMVPGRFALSYDIKPNGDPVTQGKKRGRKTNAIKAEMAKNAAMNAEYRGDEFNDEFDYDDDDDDDDDEIDYDEFPFENEESHID